MSNPFLEQFERRRVELETRMLRMPGASAVVQRWGGNNGIGQQYLHALPTVTGLVELLSKSPRTAGTFRDRVERSGPCKIRHHEIESAFCCFGIGYHYRVMAKRSGDPALANKLTGLATLSLMSPAELEKVDWVTRTFSATGRDGSKDVMAQANLMQWWLTGSENASRAHQIDMMLQQYNDFVQSAFDAALQHQIFMQFPW
jgi:hypothetical protein